MFGQLEALAQKRRELDALEAEWLRDVAAYDRSDDWRADGYANPASALRAACRLDAGVAHGHVDLARKLASLPCVPAAFGEGEISRRHAAVIAGAYAPARAVAIEQIEAVLVDVARDHAPKDLAAAVRHATDAIDGDGGAASDEALYHRRRYHGSRTLDGMLCVDALYDPESADVHEAAITAELERDHRAHDARTPGQRRADALTNLLRRSLDRAEIGTARAVRPHVSYVVHVSEPAPREQACDRLDLAGVARTGHDGARPPSAAALNRILCDCGLSRIVLRGRSEMLDVGRATRTVNAAQWKALVVRDVHCRAPGCTQSPARCEAHHVVHWNDGGATDLANLQLLCWHHHRERHTEEAGARARGR